jgi:hypothetical protein
MIHCIHCPSSLSERSIGLLTVGSVTSELTDSSSCRFSSCQTQFYPVEARKLTAVLGDNIVAYLLKARTVEPDKRLRNTQRWNNCWKQCFLCCPCQGYIMRTNCHYERVLRRHIVEKEVGVRWPPDSKDVSPVAEERPLLETTTKQRSEDHD